MDDPPAPDSLPTYLRDAVDRQDRDTLRDVIDYCERRIEYLNALENREFGDDELADEGEEIVDVEETREGTKVVKKVPCGKENCSTCPHGPYEYRVRREGDSVNWEYVGPVE